MRDANKKLSIIKNQAITDIIFWPSILSAGYYDHFMSKILVCVFIGFFLFNSLICLIIAIRVDKFKEVQPLVDALLKTYKDTEFITKYRTISTAVEFAFMVYFGWYVLSALFAAAFIIGLDAKRRVYDSI